MKKAICFGNVPALGSHAEHVALLQDAGFDGLEAPQFDSPAEAEELAGLARAAGLEIHSVMCGTHWQKPLSAPAENERREGVAGVERALHQAALAGADAVLVVPGVVSPEVPYDQAYTASRQSLRDLLPLAEELGVMICLENVWNKFLLSPLETRDYIDSFASPLLQAYFDVGNILLYGYPEQWIAILGQRIKKVHIKDFNISTKQFVGLLQGDVDYPAVIEALRGVGYDGYLTAELRPYAQFPRQFIYDTAAQMDAILGR